MQQKHLVVSIILFATLLLMLNPTGLVYADGEDPTTEISTEEPIAETSVERSSEESTVETGMVINTEETEIAPTEETHTQDPTAEPTATESEMQLESTADPVEETAAQEEQVGESLAEVVEALAESDMVLIDGEGEPIPLASKEAAETLSVADPWFIGSDGNMYRYYPTGTSLPADCGTGNIICQLSDTPIQAAIDNDFSTESIIHIDAGTYSEQILITKNVTLQGEEGTIIKAPTENIYSYTIPESSENWEPVVMVNGGDNIINVNIYGLIINGNDRQPTSGSRSAGVLLRNVEGEVVGNTVENMYQNGAETFGISVYGDSNLSIGENTVSGYSRGGITANGDNGDLPDPTVIIYENTVVGPGMDVPVTWTPNGIQIAWGASGEIIANEVSGNGYPGEDWTGSGIIVAAADDVTIAENHVHDNETGISVIGDIFYGTEDVSERTSIYSNLVENNEWGISIQDLSADTTIAENTIITNWVDGIDVWYSSSSDSEPTNTIIRDNLIYGNNPSGTADCGGLWTNLTEAITALYNYWGCGGGPGTSGCDLIVGQVSYDPWLLDPDGDGVFESSDGSGGYVDNCPTVYNPDQKDSDGNTIGDACEPTPSAPPAPAVTPITTPSVIIPVVSGQLVALSSDFADTLELPSGSQIIFNQIMNGFEALVTEKSEELLPFNLPEDNVFVSAITIDIFKDGDPVNNLEEGTFSISFAILTDLEGAEFVILFWDADAGEWVEISSFDVVNGMCCFETDLTGTFVLSTR